MTRKKKYVHVAVLEAFDSLRPIGMECRHLDGNPENNHILNLKWGTHQENMQDSIKHGTFSYAGLPGEKHANSKLTELQVIEIKKLLKLGGVNHTEIGKKYNVHNSTISYINKGRLWKHIQI